MLRSGDHLAPLPTKANSPTATTRRRGNSWQPPPQESRCCNAAATRHRIAAMGYCCNASTHCGNARIAAMPQRIAAIPFQCSYCRNIAAMLMLLAMPFNIAATCIAAILKRIAAMLPLLHHCSNAAIARGIAATPQYFPDATLEHNEDGQRVVVQEQLRTNTSTLSSTGIVAGCSPGRDAWRAANCTNASFNSNAHFTR